MIIKLNTDSLNTKQCDKSVYREFMCIAPKRDWLLMRFDANQNGKIAATLVDLYAELRREDCDFTTDSEC